MLANRTILQGEVALFFGRLRMSRICREEVIKILIDAKRPAAERLYQSNKISFDEYRTMNGYREIIRAAGL